VVAVTFLCARLIPVNPTTVGFLYLITILLIATKWGLREAVLASIVATLCFNFFFLPPVGTFTIADVQNWVALFAFLVTSLIASQLSERAKRRTMEVESRQTEIERLYALSRAILLTDAKQPIAKQIAGEIAAIYQVPSVAIYDRGSLDIHRAGPEDIPGVQQKLQDAAMMGTMSRDEETQTIVSAITLGGQPIGSLALKGGFFSDTALQALSNLVAIALEKARGQELASRAEAARQSEEFKSTLLDALAHEFKTPLTSVKAATSAILSPGVLKPEEQRDLLTIIDQEADRLSALVTEAIQLARMEAGKIQPKRQQYPVGALIETTLQQMETALEGRTVDCSVPDDLPPILVDVGLMQLLIRQLIDNAVKYSPPGSPIRVAAKPSGNSILISIRNDGQGISAPEKSRIFEKFYRGAGARSQVPGTGMGLAIAREVVLAHGGNIWVESGPGEGAEFFASVPTGGKEI
jgi:two-component system sensor histidine kinase KdpD